jgi:DNA-binding beta-propeller fold protein YncE
MRASSGSSIAIATVLATSAACGPPERAPDERALASRAYVVSLDSAELTVIDLDRLEIIARVDTGGVGNHMADLSGDLGEIYVASAYTSELVVVDARSFDVVDRIPVARHPTHLTLTPDRRLVAVMGEEDSAISFVDPVRRAEIKRLTGFATPHFMRFSRDGQFGYVANIGAHHLSRVDLTTLELDGHVVLDGFAGPPQATPAPDERGFADAQIDAHGMLYAAHGATGRVLVYDTEAHEKRAELQVGAGPWVAFAEHPFAGLPLRHLVGNLGDRTVSLIDGQARTVMRTLPGDEESYGVNFSSRAPNKAFVMNRQRQDVAVVDTFLAEIRERIPVGGNTETASTSADGRLVVAAVSGADRVVVIDAVSNEIVKTFDGVGRYPWSVVIPYGQNYCH